VERLDFVRDVERDVGSVMVSSPAHRGDADGLKLRPRFSRDWAEPTSKVGSAQSACGELYSATR